MKKHKNYNLNFKAKVVSEIEFGKYSPEKARKIYGIGGKMTVYRWIEGFNKKDLINKKLSVQSKKEKNKKESLQFQRKIKDLEKSLKTEQNKTLVLETLLGCANKYYNVDIKKNFGVLASKS